MFDCSDNAALVDGASWELVYTICKLKKKKKNGLGVFTLNIQRVISEQTM